VSPRTSRGSIRRRARAERRKLKREHREWFRFGEFFVVSVIGFALDTVILNALVVGAGLDTTLESVGAKALSASTAGLLNFAMHRRWTFHDRPGPFWQELGRYALVRSSAIALSLFLFGVFRYGFSLVLSPHLGPHLTALWSANLAQVGASMLVLLFSYVLHQHFTFAVRPKRRPPGAGTKAIASDDS
jgi:putative flippase GtrA